MAPRMRCAVPSRRVPRISHSDQTSGPLDAWASTRTLMSGTKAEICYQFARTCSLPTNARLG